MVLQAAEYEAAQGLALQQFFDSTAGRFQTPTGRAWAAEIIRRRAEASAGVPAVPFGEPWGSPPHSKGQPPGSEAHSSVRSSQCCWRMRCRSCQRSWRCQQ